MSELWISIAAVLFQQGRHLLHAEGVPELGHEREPSAGHERVGQPGSLVPVLVVQGHLGLQGHGRVPGIAAGHVHVRLRKRGDGRIQVLIDELVNLGDGTHVHGGQFFGGHGPVDERNGAEGTH